MRKYVMIGFALLPLLLTVSYAAQNWSVDDSSHSWGFPSEDGGTSSYLGVDIADVTTDRLSALKLKEEKASRSPWSIRMLQPEKRASRSTMSS